MLECKNIVLKYHDKLILNDINLEFNHGLVCILGQNGVGKSSLVRILSGQNCEYQGVVSMNGQNMKQMSILEISKTFVFMNQNYEVAFDFTAEEIIKMGFHGLKFNFEVYEKAIKMTHVECILQRSYKTLSGGEKQRVQFARAIARFYAVKGKVLFLDEPSSSADIKQEMNMIQIAKSIASEGNCVIMISHNITLALKYGDKILLINNGEVQKYASSISDSDIMECFNIDNALYCNVIN